MIEACPTRAHQVQQMKMAELMTVLEIADYVVEGGRDCVGEGPAIDHVI